MFEEIKNLDNNYVSNTYNRFNVAFKCGKGSTLYDFNDKKYIDFSSGIGVNAFGVCDDVWSNAVIEQTKRLSHMSNLYYTLPQAQLAHLLCSKTGMKKVFFANSGAEANEGAIKTARKYSHDKYNENRSEIITLVNSFHGRTITTLKATGQDVFHKNFYPFTEGFNYAIANDIEDVKSKINDKTCAIMMELVQGEGGVLPLDKAFVKEVEKIAKEKDLLLIIDEVQTGNGRTGYLYAYQGFDINPDIVTTAKGIGGGLPLGAILFNEKTEKVLGFGDHATTFGGNPIVTAGAISIIERLTPEFLDAVKLKGEYISEYCKQIKNVVSVSGMGMMIGVKTTKNARDIVSKCLENGLVVLTAKDKIRFLPPLNISATELEEGLKIFKKVVEEE